MNYSLKTKIFLSLIIFLGIFVFSNCHASIISIIGSNITSSDNFPHSGGAILGNSISFTAGTVGSPNIIGIDGGDLTIAANKTLQLKNYNIFVINPGNEIVNQGGYIPKDSSALGIQIVHGYLWAKDGDDDGCFVGPIKYNQSKTIPDPSWTDSSKYKRIVDLSYANDPDDASAGDGGPSCVESLDFSILLNPDYATIERPVSGSTVVSTTLTTTLIAGLAQGVTFSVSGLPAGVTNDPLTNCTLPCTAQNLKFNVSSSAALGVHDILLTATAGSVSQTFSFTLTIEETPVTFTLTASPSSTTLNKPSSGSTNVSTGITATLQTGTAPTVTFGVGTLPTGVTLVNALSGCTLNCSRTVTLAVSSSAVVGSYTIEVTATTSGGVSVTEDFTLNINASVITFDFSLSASPDPITIAKPAISFITASSTVQITATKISGTAQAITFDAVDFNGDSTTGVTFSTLSSCTPNCSKTLTINVAYDAVPGTYTVLVSATGGGVTRDTTFDLIINPPDFAFVVWLNPLSGSINRPTSGTITATTTVEVRSGVGTPQLVSLAVSGLPTGVTASPLTSCTPNPNCALQNLTFTIGSTAVSGTYNITVTGTGGGATDSDTFVLTIAELFVPMELPECVQSGLTTGVWAKHNTNLWLTSNMCKMGTTCRHKSLLGCLLTGGTDFFTTPGGFANAGTWIGNLCIGLPAGQYIDMCVENRDDPATYQSLPGCPFIGTMGGVYSKDASCTWSNFCPINTNCSSSCGSGNTVTTKSGQYGAYCGWSGCHYCVIGGTGSSSSVIPYTLVVDTKSGTGTGTVISSDSKIDCGETCDNIFDSGTTVNLTANPATGSVLASWTGCTSSSGTSCTVSMTEAKTVAAVFNLSVVVNPTLTVTKNGTGTITTSDSKINCGSDCSESYTTGTSIDLTATAGTGFTFASWSGCTSSSGTSCTVSMTASKTVTATFNAVTKYRLTVNKTGTGSGTVSSSPSGISNCSGTCTADFTSGTSVTLTASPGSNTNFGSWSGCTSSSGTSCTVLMTAAKTVTATFNLKTVYTLTVVKTGNGSGTVSSSPSGINSCSGTCTADFTSGASVTLTATPGSGSIFSTWSGSCSGSSRTCTVSMTTARNVIATFNTSAAWTPCTPNGCTSSSSCGYFYGSAGKTVSCPSGKTYVTGSCVAMPNNHVTSASHTTTSYTCKTACNGAICLRTDGCVSIQCQ